MSVTGVDQKCRTRGVAQKCCSEVSVGSVAQQCGSDLLTRSVDQKRRSEVLRRSVDEVLIRSVAPSEVLRRSVALKYRSEVWIMKHRSEVLLRTVDRGVGQRCRSAVSIQQCCPEVCVCVCQKCQFSTVAQKFRSEVSMSGVDQKWLSELSMRSVECCSSVSIRSVVQQCCSNCRSEV